MLVIVPIWSASPPESLRAFLQTTDFYRRIFHFFGPPSMVARVLPPLSALLAGWHLPRHHHALLLNAIVMVGILIFTLVYIYPINDVLFEQAGDSGTPEQIRAMLNHWILVDRLRFAFGCVAFLALLWAFSLPVPRRT